MNQFLAQKRALSMGNITRQIKAQRPDGCDSCQEISLEQITSAKQGQCFCIELPSEYNYVNYVLIVGDGLTIEGYNTLNNHIGPIENAFGASTGYYKITATKDTPIAYYRGAFSGDEESNYIVIFKNSWEGTLQSVSDIESWEQKRGTFSQERAIFFSPSEITLQYELKEGDLSLIVDEQTIRDPQTQGTVSGMHITIGSTPVFERGQTGKFEASVDVTSSVANPPSYYPDKIFQIKPNLIFSAALEDYEFLSDQGGLSGGAIAGIVIACIVVVAVIVFCVVWFVVLKKPCPCGGKQDGEPAA